MWGSVSLDQFRSYKPTQNILTGQYDAPPPCFCGNRGIQNDNLALVSLLRQDKKIYIYHPSLCLNNCLVIFLTSSLFSVLNTQNDASRYFQHPRETYTNTLLYICSRTIFLYILPYYTIYINRFFLYVLGM